MAEEDQAFLKNWLNDLPTTPCHYCRGSTTYQNNKFLLHGTKIINLYDEFIKAATDAQVRLE